MEQQATLPPEVRALYSIIAEISSSRDEQALLDTMLKQLVTELPYKAATLRLLNEEEQVLELKAAYGLSQEYLSKGAVEVARSAMDQRALAGECVIIADMRSDDQVQYSQAASAEGLASTLVVPLRTRDRVIGVLRVYTAERQTFDHGEQALLEAVAALGGQAIMRARLYHAFEALASSINSRLELSSVLPTLLISMVQELHIKGGSIRLLGPTKRRLHLAAAYGLSQDYLHKGIVEVAQSPIDQRVLAGEVVAIEDVTTGGAFQYTAAADREGIRAVLVLPLRVQTQPIGVLRIYSGQVRRFSEEELAFACTAADLGAVAIENARLHEALKARLDSLREDTDGWYRFLGLG